MVSFILCWYLMFLMCDAQGYQRDDSRRRWSSASQNCRLLGSSNTGQFSLNDINLQDSIIEDNKKYWIGGISVHTDWFSILSCYNISQAVNILIVEAEVNVNPNSIDPVYRCLLACNRQSFALSLYGGFQFKLVEETVRIQCTREETTNLLQLANFLTKRKNSRCYCAGTLMFQNRCGATQFSNSPYDFYGITNTSGYIAMVQYWTDYAPPIGGRGTGDCVAAFVTDEIDVMNNHQYLPCDTKLPSLCFNSLNNSATFLNYERKNWSDAYLACGPDGLLSVPAGIYSIVGSHQTLAWIGATRRSQKRWSDGLVENRMEYNCLAISTNNGVLSVTVEKCNRELPSLCESGSGGTSQVSVQDCPDSSQVITALVIITVLLLLVCVALIVFILYTRYQRNKYIAQQMYEKPTPRTQRSNEPTYDELREPEYTEPVYTVS